MGKGKQEYYEDPCEHVVHMECTKHNFVQVATFDRRAKLARFVSRAYLRCPGDGIAHELLVSFNEALDRNCTPKQLQSLVDCFPRPGRVVPSTTNYETLECRLHQLQQRTTPCTTVLSTEVSTDSPQGAVYELYRVAYRSVQVSDEHGQYTALPGSGLPPSQVSVPETSYAAMTTTATHNDQYTRGHDSRVIQLPSQSNDLPASYYTSQFQDQPFTWDDAERKFNQIVQGRTHLQYAEMSGVASDDSSIQQTPDAYYPPQTALSDPSASDVTSSGPLSHDGPSHAPTT